MKLRKVIDNILGKFLVFIMSVLVIDVLWQVFSRYILNAPSDFTDELAGFLLIWVGLVGAAYATGTKQHLAIDILPSKLPPEKRRIVDIIINIFIFLFAVSVLIVGGTWLVYTRFYLGQLSAALEIPLGYVYLVLPLSGLLISYYALDDIATILKSKNEQQNP